MKEKTAQLKRKLFRRYKIIILEEQTLSEEYTLRLNWFNLLVAAVISSVLIFFFSLFLLAFTPISKIFIPSSDLAILRSKQEIISLADQVEELEGRIESDEVYLNQLRIIISGEDPKDKQPNEPTLQALPSLIAKNHIQDSLTNASLKNFILPLKGIITTQFADPDDHLGIDIAAKTGQPIVSIESGKVIAVKFRKDTGHIIVIQHPNEIISTYKHNQQILKKIHQSVKKGEKIALVGSTGEFSTGPHLHFELKINGKEVNPQDYLPFN